MLASIFMPQVFQARNGMETVLTITSDKYDFGCIKLKSVLNLQQINHVTEINPNQSFSPTERLPCLLLNGQLYGGSSIYERLSSEFGLEGHLSTKQRAESHALESLIKSKILFGIDYEIWYENERFRDSTVNNRGAMYAWPLNHIIPRMERSTKMNEMLAIQPVLRSDFIYKEVAAAFESLSVILGDGNYFFGDQPSVLDSSLFACLSITLSPEFKNTRIASAVSQTNLVAFHQRILVLS